MTRVLAIDAGESTGLSVVDFSTEDAPVVRYLAQFSAPVVDTTYTAKSTYSIYRPDVVIVEQFNLRPGNQFVADLSTVYRNGAIEFMLHDYFEVAPVWQTPAQAKGLVSDTVLKRLGEAFWPTGRTVGQKDAHDARDALRHAVFYAVEVLNHRPTIELGWPKPEEV